MGARYVCREGLMKEDDRWWRSPGPPDLVKVKSSLFHQVGNKWYYSLFGYYPGREENGWKVGLKGKRVEGKLVLPTNLPYRKRSLRTLYDGPWESKGGNVTLGDQTPSLPSWWHTIRTQGHLWFPFRGPVGSIRNLSQWKKVVGDRLSNCPKQSIGRWGSRSGESEMSCRLRPSQDTTEQTLCP